MNSGLLTRLRNEVEGKVEVDVPLAPYTTWKVGGNADWLIEPQSVASLEKAAMILNVAEVQWLAIGGGSNLLVKDGGIRGAVISTRKLRHIQVEDNGIVRAEAGASLAEVIKKSLAAGLGGLEQLAGIPGTIGGATIMNAGAGEMELGKVVRNVTLFDGGQRITWDNAQCGFKYRCSAIPASTLVMSVELELSTGNTEQLSTAYSERLAARRLAHPYELPNAGSVFMNPEGQSAWKLIDEAGLRGERRGDAQISPQHTNFIVNHGAALATDILSLIELAQEKVAAKFGIELEPEVRIVGEDE